MDMSFLLHCTCILAGMDVSGTQITLNIIHLINAHFRLFGVIFIGFM
jgi:hypothetical protein